MEEKLEIETKSESLGNSSSNEETLREHLSTVDISTREDQNMKSSTSAEDGYPQWTWAAPKDEIPILDKGGKWMIFFRNPELDQTSDLQSEFLRSWPNIIRLVEEGILVNAKHTLPSVGRVTNVVIFYTKDSRDKADVEKSAKAIRSAVPAVSRNMFYKTNEASRAGLYQHEGHRAVSMYLYNRNNLFFERSFHKLWRVVGLDIDRLLRSLPMPSRTTDVDWLWANPSGETKMEYDFNKNGGKWILPQQDRSRNRAGLTPLDVAWQSVYSLVLEGVIRAAQCSTVARTCDRRDLGVILCYSDDYRNKAELKRVAESIRRDVSYDRPMYFKTNDATSKHYAQWYGSTYISLYRHDPDGEMCEMKNKQWIPIRDF